MDDYKIVNTIGQGTFGIVYKVVHRKTGDVRAMKKINLERKSGGVPAALVREIAIMKQLHHPSIVALLDVSFESSNLFIFYEYLPMDLKKLLELTEGPLALDLVKSYLRQLLKGIDYCQSHRVLHRDLKPENLLVDAMGHIKITDFQIARHFGIPIATYTSKVTTLWYCPPEILLGGKFYHTSVDMWSLACIFAEMANGKALFPGDSQINQLFKIFRALGTPGREIWPSARRLPDYSCNFPQWPAKSARLLLPRALQSESDACSLFEAMLCYEPEQRVSAHRALSYVYLSDARLTRPNLTPSAFEDPMEVDYVAEGLSWVTLDKGCAAGASPWATMEEGSVGGSSPWSSMEEESVVEVSPWETTEEDSMTESSTLGTVDESSVEETSTSETLEEGSVAEASTLGTMWQGSVTEASAWRNLWQGSMGETSTWVNMRQGSGAGFSNWRNLGQDSVAEASTGRAMGQGSLVKASTSATLGEGVVPEASTSGTRGEGSFSKASTCRNLGQGSVTEASTSVNMGQGFVAGFSNWRYLGQGSVAEASTRAKLGLGSVAEASTSGTIKQGSMTEASTLRDLGQSSVAETSISKSLSAGVVAEASAWGILRRTRRNLFGNASTGEALEENLTSRNKYTKGSNLINMGKGSMAEASTSRIVGKGYVAEASTSGTMGQISMAQASTWGNMEEGFMAETSTSGTLGEGSVAEASTLGTLRQAKGALRRRLFTEASTGEALEENLSRNKKKKLD